MRLWWWAAKQIADALVWKPVANLSRRNRRVPQLDSGDQNDNHILKRTTSFASTWTPFFPCKWPFQASFCLRFIWYFQASISPRRSHKLRGGGWAMTLSSQKLRSFFLWRQRKWHRPLAPSNGWNWQQPKRNSHFGRKRHPPPTPMTWRPPRPPPRHLCFLPVFDLAPVNLGPERRRQGQWRPPESLEKPEFEKHAFRRHPVDW